MKKKSVSVILGLATLLSLILAVFFWFQMNNYEPEYTEVEATVLSAKTKVTEYKNTQSTSYEIKVEYEGKTYDLKNAHSTASYIPGYTVSVLSANGNLYANIEGIKTTSPVGIVYFVFLFLTIILFGVWVTYWSKLKQQMRQNR